MTEVRRSRRSGQATRRKRSTPTTSGPPLDFTDPAAVAAWLSCLDGAARDLIAAAEDQVHPPGQRDLGRRAAGALVAEGASSLSSLIAHARAGLTTG